MTNNPIRVSVNNQQRLTVRSVAVSQSGSAPTNLSQLQDVDATDADDGETLVYDSANSKFVVKTIDIDGGSF